MIIWFGGGLGNQMFQYALYKAAEEKGFDVKADLSWYKNKKNPEPYQLESLFNIKTKECTKEELDGYNNKLSNYIDRALYRLHIDHKNLNRRKIIEYKSNYISDLFTSKHSEKYLLGYWQSEDYFKFRESAIRKLYLFPELDERNKMTFEEMDKYESVSLHVRRTSYLTLAASKVYENLSETDYYNIAIKKIKDMSGSNIKLFLFTDDIEWCRKNLDLDSDPVIIDNNRGADSYRDMQLMSCCKHNIIANSSFSWWGAWLNSNPEKIVIGPEKWFVKSSGITSNKIIPESWVTL